METTIRIKKSTLQKSIFLVFCLALLLLLLQRAGISLIDITKGNSLLAIFFTGLLVGGLTCMAVQGGLLAATIAQREEGRLKDELTKGAALPIVAFLTAKLIAYTVLGFLLGWLGEVFQLSLATRVIVQFLVVIFMIGTALNILDVHPIFRYFVIQPPKFLTRMVRKQAKSKDIFAPALLGAFTIFIPCGTTQAMMALAIASGNPWIGAATLFSFILGTSPLFFILGYFATRLGETLHQHFMRIAALVLIFLALFNLNNTLALTGSKWTASTIIASTWCVVTDCQETVSTSQTTVNEATITFTNGGYTPSLITVKKGTKVTLHLSNRGAQGCVQAFTIPSLGIQQLVPLGKQSDIVFNAPSTTEEIPFMCSMGMYRGVIQVV